MLASLLRNLEVQIKKLDVEDLVEINVKQDGGEKPTGTKRNELLQEATGKYVISIDDDDAVPDYYIEELLAAAQSDADCFGMSGIMLTNGSMEKKWHISKDYEYRTGRDEKGEEVYFRFPNHITGIRASIAKKFKFPDVYQFEDYAFALAIHQSGEIKTEYRIERAPMYVYQFVPVK